MSKLQPFILPVVSADKFYPIDPLDGRYFDPEIAAYLSEQTAITYQAYVEAALVQTLADFGVCSQKIADEIEAASKLVTVEAVWEEEKVTKHNIKALVNCIKANVSEEARPFVHFGATSNDIISTSISLQLRDATNELVIPRLNTLVKTLLVLTKEYAETIQIGRTHGQHAVPITFGFAIAEYVSRLGDCIEKLQSLSDGLRGKFSGAVGSYNALSVFIDDPIKFEKTILSHLNIPVAPYSTQIVPPENTIRLMEELYIASGIMANLSHDMRHLQRSEIGEVRERFEAGQTGSSTMAHKRNPWNFENVISMSKQVAAQVVTANQNISSEHQRDLTDSASNRFYNMSFAIVASMTKRLNDVMAKLEVDDENMQRNLYLTKGAIAAEPLYLLLEKYGHTTAHEAAKEISHEALADGVSLYEAAKANTAIASYWAKFTEKERSLIENPERNYSGLAAQKALAVHEYWSQKLK